MKTIIHSCRQGFSLLEVLVSVFVVLVGLLGVATMIPAGRHEILQARKADMGADLSRAIMNCVVTQISNGWNPGNNNFYIAANDSGELAARLLTGLSGFGATFSQCPQTINNNRTFNGDDDVSFSEDNDNKIQVFDGVNNELLGTGVYTACATVVSLGGGYYEVTGLAVYRYNNETDTSTFNRGSYAFVPDDSGKYRWYKIENVYAARGSSTIVTAAGDKSSRDAKSLGDVIGICKKVVRIDSYTAN